MLNNKIQSLFFCMNEFMVWLLLLANLSDQLIFKLEAPLKSEKSTHSPLNFSHTITLH